MRDAAHMCDDSRERAVGTSHSRPPRRMSRLGPAFLFAVLAVVERQTLFFTRSKLHILATFGKRHGKRLGKPGTSFWSYRV